MKELPHLSLVIMMRYIKTLSFGDSFVVLNRKKFHKVDLNVTRHLDFELKQNDWTLLILHYLGLDHVGQ